MLHMRYYQVVILHINLHPETSESIGNYAKIAHRHILYSYAFANHCRHSYERADLNHVRKYGMPRPVQVFHADYRQQVRGYSAYACSHTVEQMA